MILNCVFSDRVDNDSYVELKVHLTSALRGYHNLSAQPVLLSPLRGLLYRSFVFPQSGESSDPGLLITLQGLLTHCS